MLVMRRLRLYHAALAVLVVLAYVTGDDDSLHAWLGYGVAALIIIRLIWALTGVPQLGLMRFYPRFEGLRLTTAITHPAISRTLLLGIATCLIGVTFSGIVMDRGLTSGLADRTISRPSVVGNVQQAERHRDEGDEGESLIGEVHEALANLLVMFILTHIAYLALFKRPLALFMIFSHTPTKGDASP